MPATELSRIKNAVVEQKRLRKAAEARANTAEAALSIALRSTAPASSGVRDGWRVKALEWRDAWFGDSDNIVGWEAETPWGRLTPCLAGYRDSSGNRYKQHSDVPAELKAERIAAATEGYERHILSALDAPSAPPEPYSQTAHIAHDMRMRRFPEQSSVEQYEAERNEQSNGGSATTDTGSDPVSPSAAQRENPRNGEGTVEQTETTSADVGFTRASAPIASPEPISDGRFYAEHSRAQDPAGYDAMMASARDRIAKTVEHGEYLIMPISGPGPYYFEFQHANYDPENNDLRHGYGSTVDDCKQQIADLEFERSAIKSSPPEPSGASQGEGEGGARKLVEEIANNGFYSQKHAPMILDDYVNRARAVVAVAKVSKTDETGWLIEKDDPPVYCVLSDDYDEHWTSDASRALRFARREDAQAYSDHVGWTTPPVRITEHMWPAPPDTGDQPQGGDRG